MTDFISSDAPARTRTTAAFRILVLLLAILLAVFGVWLMVTEWLRPTSRASATILHRQSDAGAIDRARLAARIGLVRGDLWADYAATLVGVARPERKASLVREEAGTAGHNAVTLAPLDPIAWLALAEISMDVGAAASTTGGMLNMSFLTGPNAVALAPQRLSAVARSLSRTDRDLRALAVRDLRVLVQQADGIVQLKAVWRATPGPGRDFLAGIVQEVDGKILQDLQTIQ